MKDRGCCGHTFFASGNAAAHALDAADGVIDGKFFGAQIAGAPQSFAVPGYGVRDLLA